MAVSIDWANKVINIPKADTLLISAGPPEIRQLDIDLFRKDLNALQAGENGMPFETTHTHNQPVTVGGVTLARVVEIINGYTLTFEDGQYAVNLVGANSNLADVTNVNQVSIRSANSAGLTFSEEINAQSFINGQVTLDVNEGLPGTAFPRGTPTDPVDNLPDALFIAQSRGLHGILLTGFVTATASENLDGIAIEGGSGASNVVWLNGCSTINSSFERLVLAGAQNGLSRVVDCILGATGIGAYTGAQGRYVNCIINSAGGVTQETTGVGTLFDNCAFTMPDAPIIPIDANGKAFNLREVTGRIEIRNATAAESQDIHLNGAEVTIASSCTAGTFIFSGNGTVIDNSGGTVLDESRLGVVSATISAAEQTAIANKVIPHVWAANS